MTATVAVAANVARERVGEAVEEQGAVREARERVVERAALEQVLGAAEVGDVFHLGDEPRLGVRHLARDLGDRDAAPDRVAVRVDVALLHLVVGQFARGELREEVAVAREVVGMRELAESATDHRLLLEPEDAREGGVQSEIVTARVEDRHSDRGGVEGGAEEVIAMAHSTLLGGAIARGAARRPRILSARRARA